MADHVINITIAMILGDIDVGLSHSDKNVRIEYLAAARHRVGRLMKHIDAEVDSLRRAAELKEKSLGKTRLMKLTRSR